MQGQDVSVIKLIIVLPLLLLLLGLQLSVGLVGLLVDILLIECFVPYLIFVSIYQEILLYFSCFGLSDHQLSQITLLWHLYKQGKVCQLFSSSRQLLLRVIAIPILAAIAVLQISIFPLQLILVILTRTKIYFKVSQKLLALAVLLVHTTQ